MANDAYTFEDEDRQDDNGEYEYFCYVEEMKIEEANKELNKVKYESI